MTMTDLRGDFWDGLTDRVVRFLEGSPVLTSVEDERRKRIAVRARTAVATAKRGWVHVAAHSEVAGLRLLQLGAALAALAIRLLAVGRERAEPRLLAAVAWVAAAWPESRAGRAVAAAADRAAAALRWLVVLAFTGGMSALAPPSRAAEDKLSEEEFETPEKLAAAAALDR